MNPLFCAFLAFVAIAECEKRPGVAPLIELNDGKTIPGLGLGTSLGLAKDGSRVKVTNDDVQKAVEAAIDAGYRHIDTAALYHTEAQVGRAIKNKIEEGVVQREDLFITTKLWNNHHEKDAVIPALRESLIALGLEYVDLYLIHYPIAVFNNGTYYDTDYVETWKGMVEARRRGLTRSIGVSNFNKHQLKRLISLNSVKPAVLQVELNLNLQQPELLTFCRTHNVAVIGYTPFGSLFYHRAAKDAPPPRIDEEALLKIADRHHKTVAQVTLRYFVELGVIPIPKSVTKRRIEQNIKVFDFQLNQQERDLMKSYDKQYRTRDVLWWKDSPYYPFKN